MIFQYLVAIGDDHATLADQRLAREASESAGTVTQDWKNGRVTYKGNRSSTRQGAKEETMHEIDDIGLFPLN